MYTIAFFVVDSAVVICSSDKVGETDLTMTKPLTEPIEKPAAQDDNDEQVKAASILVEEKRGKNS